MPGRHLIVWAFDVRDEHRVAFEAAYGATGDWAQLFRLGDGYIRTELARRHDPPASYLVLDVWESRAAFDAFRSHHAAAYEELDRACESLTITETLIGTYDLLE